MICMFINFSFVYLRLQRQTEANFDDILWANMSEYFSAFLPIYFKQTILEKVF